MAASCSFMRLFYGTKYSFNFCDSFSQSSLHRKVIYNHLSHFKRCSTLQDANSAVQDTYSEFEKMIRERRRRVKKSVLVHVYSKHVMMKLFDHCQKYGSICRAFHYNLEKEKNFALIEFENEAGIQKLLSDTGHFDRPNIIPAHSRCLWYHETESNKDDLPPSEFLTNDPPTEEDIINKLKKAQSVSEQMTSLHELLKLTELGQLLRFFICQQLELAFAGLFPSLTVLPFGSSVNGFGKFNCDLDMALCLGDLTQNGKNSPKLYFHTKCSVTNTRMQVQRHLETIGDIISNFFPGCSNVQRILQARVPIVKFKHELANTECDLTMGNLSGVYMSELLYIFGEFDHRVRPLVFTVLKWAKQNGLTQDVPGHWITNFTLILMVMIFLQIRPNPILPSLKTLHDLSDKSHQRLSEGINCTFLRNLHQFPKMNNQEDLSDLLREFFSYYATFDYKNRGLSLITGSEVVKPNHCSIYIQNPFETELNVCKNVSADELVRIQEKMGTALWKLETLRQPDSSMPWGLLELFDVQGQNGIEKVSRFSVSSFFDKKTMPNLRTRSATKAESVNDTFISGKNRSSKKNSDGQPNVDKFLQSASKAILSEMESRRQNQNAKDKPRRRKARTKQWPF